MKLFINVKYDIFMSYLKNYGNSYDIIFILNKYLRIFLFIFGTFYAIIRQVVKDKGNKIRREKGEII